MILYLGIKVNVIDKKMFLEFLKNPI